MERRGKCGAGGKCGEDGKSDGEGGGKSSHANRL
jgi:hypothetical protein